MGDTPRIQDRALLLRFAEAPIAQALGAWMAQIEREQIERAMPALQPATRSAEPPRL